MSSVVCSLTPQPQLKEEALRLGFEDFLKRTVHRRCAREQGDQHVTGASEDQQQWEAVTILGLEIKARAGEAWGMALAGLRL